MRVSTATFSHAARSLSSWSACARTEVTASVPSCRRSVVLSASRARSIARAAELLGRFRLAFRHATDAGHKSFRLEPFEPRPLAVTRELSFDVFALGSVVRGQQLAFRHSPQRFD